MLASTVIRTDLINLLTKRLFSKMLFDKHLAGTLEKILSSPRLCKRKRSKTCSTELKKIPETSPPAPRNDLLSQDKIAKQDRSAENSSKHRIKQPLTIISFSLDIASLNDDNHYHSSQEFFNFLTDSARQADEHENNINIAMIQIGKMEELVESNKKLLSLIRKFNSTLGVNDVTLGVDDITLGVNGVTWTIVEVTLPINNVIIKHISESLDEHTAVLEEMNERSRDYKDNIMLAEIDQEIGIDLKSHLVAMNKILSQMTTKCHTSSHARELGAKSTLECESGS